MHNLNKAVRRSWQAELLSPWICLFVWAIVTEPFVFSQTSSLKVSERWRKCSLGSCWNWNSNWSSFCFTKTNRLKWEVSWSQRWWMQNRAVCDELRRCASSCFRLCKQNETGSLIRLKNHKSTTAHLYLLDCKPPLLGIAPVIFTLLNCH